MAAKASPTTYGLLGLLAVRPWTGYELTNQLHRSLRFVWSSSDGHLYREQKKLLDLGWATAQEEQVGRRSRKRYTITPAGRRALRDWLATEPEEPHFEIEGLLRLFFADQGAMDDLVRSLEATATNTRAMLDELLDNVSEYLEEGGPMWMLEKGTGTATDERLEFHGRPMFPERLPLIAVVLEILTALLAEIENFTLAAAAEIRGWPSNGDPALAAVTRRRLERIQATHARSIDD